MEAMQLIETLAVQEKAESNVFDIACGRAFPLGATPLRNGVNFSVYSRDASGVELLLFDRGG